MLTLAILQAINQWVPAVWLYVALRRVISYFGEQIMGLQEDMQLELESINASTNDLASDIDDLVSKLPATGGLSEEQAQQVLTAMRGASGALKAVAQKWPKVEQPPTT